MVKLSVVMSVYNGEAALARTMESITGQTLRDFELIVIDDGSTDATPSILRDYAARDPRICVISQKNTGLTRALIRGCREARGDLIARHDCGDVSYPERFEKQIALFDEGSVLVSCATRFVGPEGEELYVVRGDGETIRRSLLTGTLGTLRGIPGHGSAMFRKQAYDQVGGYRAEFCAAQDIDLWIRLARIGTIAVADDVLYEYTVEVGGLTARAREAQTECVRFAVAIRDAPPERQRELFDQAGRVAVRRRASRAELGNANYFLASCLLKRRDPRWVRYAWRVVRLNPLHVRAWARLILRR
jgi:glycosyltransferase involved in cell wall biosynthesis